MTVTLDAARQAAYDVLYEVGVNDAYANLTMQAALAEHDLSGRDAAFATELAFGTLRMQGLLDPVIAAAANRGIDRIDPSVRDVLRLGTYQLLLMRVPPHAAVATSVEMAHFVAPRAAGFINAVLRKVTKSSLEQWVARIAPDSVSDPFGHLSVVHSHPRWIVNALADALAQAPGGAAGLADLLATNNRPGRVTLAVRPGLADPAVITEQTGGESGLWSPWAVRLSGGNPGRLAAVREGLVGVQDEGSQLMALALAAAEVSGRDEHWLDMCAGPGGKAALLAGLANERGARLTALDLHEHRVALVRQSLRAIPGDHRVEQADATVAGWSPGEADRVLLDVPCTGLGVLRRRPESRWRRTPTDIAELAPLQRSLLRAGLSAVRPGGVVAYVTCSPHVAETDLVIKDVLADRDDVVLERTADLFPGVPDVADGDYARLWPHVHDTDGMFLAVLRRR